MNEYTNSVGACVPDSQYGMGVCRQVGRWQVHYGMCVDRWVKFEENVEEGGERWSKPHVASLSLHSLFEVRKSMVSGVIALDMEASNMRDISGEWYMYFDQVSKFLHELKFGPVCMLYDL